MELLTFALNSLYSWVPKYKVSFPQLCDPEEFLLLFINRNEKLVEFLENVLQVIFSYQVLSYSKFNVEGFIPVCEIALRSILVHKLHCISHCLNSTF